MGNKSKKEHKKNVKVEKPIIDTEVPVVDGNKSREVRKKEGLGFRQKMILKRKPDISFLITMLNSNGTCKQFVIATTKETFSYKGKIYHLRYENSWFDLSFNQYRLYYFDDYVEPIDRAVMKQGDEKFFSVTSSNIKPLIKQEFVKALTQAGELSKYLKITMVCSAITLFLVGGSLLLGYFG